MRTWMRVSSIVALLVTLCAFSEQATAQSRQPKMRIKIDPDVTLLSRERVPALNPLRFSRDGAYLFVVSGREVRRFDLSRRRFDLRHPLQNQVVLSGESNTPVRTVYEYAPSSDGTRLAVVSPGESKIYVFDLQSGYVRFQLSVPFQYDVVSDEISFSHDDALLAIRRRDAGTHYIVDVDEDSWEAIDADNFLTVEFGPVGYSG